MANKIIIKKSSVAAKVPLASDLEIGEISVNLADQKLYSKNASGTVILVGSSATGTGTVTSVSGTGTVSGLTLTGTVTSSGSLTLGGAISTLNQSTTGNAATVTTNANLTGHITSSGNAAVLGSFTSAQLLAALSDETGTGAAVFATSPTLVTPKSNTLSAVSVASGAGNSVTIAAGAGVGTGAGGSLILQAGIQATSGGDGKVIVKQVSGQTSNLLEWQSSAGSILASVSSAGSIVLSTANGIGTTLISANDIGNNLNLVLRHGAASGEMKFQGWTSTWVDRMTISNAGDIGIGTTSPGARTHIVTAAATKGLIVQGAASQTANLQEWQNSAGTVLGSVSAAGNFSGTLSDCTVDGTDAVGFRNIPINSNSAAYTAVLADSGKVIFHPSTDATARTFTIPANSSVAYPLGTAISFINMTSQVVTIAITTDTMYLSSAGTTGSRSLAQYGSATAIKMTSTTWLISGSGLT